ncbi:hypothetical protein [Thiomicrorhabdus sp. Kp2]|uniref:hypothetical protein n=1 Tax=Thiomicrorhabdus sp. Kp2 TaxID=1123518 RepID=UPI0004196367|nr:hypothetical protein [Thiomicrorhabdus sp. Kp2]
MAYQNTQEIIWIERVLKTVLVGIFIWSIWAISQYAPSYYQEQKQIEVKLAETYGISQDVVSTVQCYHGYLHYPNSEMFSGLLAVSPSIQCDSATLKQQKENRYSLEYFASIFISVVSVLLLFAFQVKSEDSRQSVNKSERINQ